MQTADYLKILKDEIHSVVFATIDENGLPDARVIDIMLVDSYSLYFITAKGKNFYRQRRAVLVSQMEPFQSIRLIACIAADAMKSVRRRQFRKEADFILIGADLLDGYDVLIMQRHKCCRKK